MYKCKLGMELHKDFGLPYENQISLLRETGFDGFLHIGKRAWMWLIWPPPPAGRA